MRPSQATIDRCFALLEATALKGERCPQNKPFGPIESTVLTEMYRRGMIMGEIYQANWRVITLLVGENAGESTARFPGAGKPYRTIGQTPTRQQSRPRPSAPRPLTREELER